MKAVSPHLFLLTSIYIFIIGRIASLVVFAMALFSNMSRRCFSLFVFFFNPCAGLSSAYNLYESYDK